MNGLEGIDMRNFEGSKYKLGLDVAEIAKRLRKEYSEAMKSGVLPKMKVSVNIRRYAGGRSIDVTIKESLSTIQVIKPTFDYDNCDPRESRYTTEFQYVIDTMQTMMDEYNYDNSDLMTDYFRVSFYGNVYVRIEGV